MGAADGPGAAAVSLGLGKGLACLPPASLPADPRRWPCGGVRPALACSPGLVCSLADLGMAHPAWGSKCILVPVCFPAAWTCRQPPGAPSAAHCFVHRVAGTVQPARQRGLLAPLRQRFASERSLQQHSKHTSPASCLTDCVRVPSCSWHRLVCVTAFLCSHAEPNH